MKKLFVFIILILLTDKLLAQNNDYVDVCGVKWARGNLIYQDGQWPHHSGFISITLMEKKVYREYISQMKDMIISTGVFAGRMP